MTSRERILNTINRKAVDYPPRDIWHTPEVLEQLKSHFNVDTDLAVYDTLGVDKICWVQAPFKGNIPRRKAPDPGEKFNEWGAAFKSKPYEGGVYQENSFYPLKEMVSPGELDSYPWPQPKDFDYQELIRQMDKYKDRTTMLTFISIFEVYSSMRSLDQALMDLYIEPEFLKKALTKIAEIQVDYIQRSLEAAPGIDLVYYSDDMGMQDRAFFSVELWNEFLSTPAQKIIDTVHDYGKKIFYHSDGAAFDIIKQLVDRGIDILNPIQYICPGMDRENLKRAFGDKVIFHGAVENQKILPFGTAQDVKTEVLNCINILGKNGGYIVAPCHNIQPNTPLENILALYEK